MKIYQRLHPLFLTSKIYMLGNTMISICYMYVIKEKSNKIKN